MKEDKRQQLIEHGYCRFEGVLSGDMLQRLQTITERVLATQSEEKAKQARSTGSMVSVMSDPGFADLIAYPQALEVLASLGYTQPTFSDGYVISKPPQGPALFWHYDWFAWEDPSAFEKAPQQLFLMYYLVDTTRQNGCLRVIPGSHITHNALHDLLDAPHSAALSEAKDMSRPEFSIRPDEVDVPVKAGDLLIGDARILHAAHGNGSGERRTLLTLWYQPDFAALPERIQAQVVKKTQHPPDSWSREAADKVNSLLPQYHGTAEPYERSLYHPKASAMD